MAFAFRQVMPSLRALLLAGAALAVPGIPAAQPALSMQVRLNIPVPADLPVCRPGTLPNEKDIYYDVVVDVDGNPASGSPQLGGSEIVIRYGLVGTLEQCEPHRASLLTGSRVVFFRYRASDGGFDTVSNSPAESVGTLRVATGPGRWAGRAIDLLIPAGRAELAGIGPQSRFQLAAAYNSGRFGTVEFKNYDFVGFAFAGDDVGDAIGDVLKCGSYSRRPDRCAESAELDAYIDIAGFQTALAATGVIDTGSYALSTDDARAGFLGARAAGDGELRFGGADFTGDEVGATTTGKQFFAVQGGITRYALLADVGAPGDPVALVRTASAPTLRTQASEITTRGELAGDRGQVIRWTLLQEISKSSVSYSVTYLFESDEALGQLRLVDFVDLAPEGDTQGRLKVVGGIDRDSIELVTTNGAGDRGYAHATSYRLARGASFDGYAAGRAATLLAAVQAGTQAFDRAGAIDAAALPAAGTSADGSRLFGPGDVATAYAYRVDPAARSASISIAVTSAPRGDRGEAAVVPPPAPATDAAAFGLPAGTRIAEAIPVDGGRAHVVVSTDALAAADANGASDVYAASAGRATLLSVDAARRALPSASRHASASGAGHVVGFVHGSELRVWEQGSGVSRRLAAAPAEPRGSIAISADGSTAVVATPDRLVASDINASNDVYALTLATGAVQLVSRTAAGNAAGDSDEPAVGADGRRIAFESGAASIDARDRNGTVRDVFVADLDAGTVAVLQRGASGDRDSTDPAISADGSVVVFTTRATNWFGTAGGTHLAAWSTALGDVQSVQYLAGAERELRAALSADGRFAAFAGASGGGATAAKLVDLANARTIELFDTATADPVLAIGADGASVVESGGPSEAKRVDNALAAASGPTEPIDSGVTGAWHDPQQPGQGLSVEYAVLAGRPFLLASWFTYVAGRASWLVGLGPVVGDRATIDFTSTRGGAFPPAFDPARVQRTAWGRATFRFYSANRARLDWSSAESGYSKSSLGLERLTRPKSGVQGTTGGGIDPCFTGSWANPAQSGHGFVLQVVDAGGADSLVAVWYVYEPDGSPLWLLGQGPIAGGRATLSFARFTGAQFPPAYSDSQMRVAPWGTATFDFRAANEVGVSWSAIEPRFGSGSLALARVAAPPPDRSCR